jgi:hypothetical protein
MTITEVWTRLFYQFRRLEGPACAQLKQNRIQLYAMILVVYDWPCSVLTQAFVESSERNVSITWSPLKVTSISVASQTRRVFVVTLALRHFRLRHVWAATTAACVPKSCNQETIRTKLIGSQLPTIFSPTCLASCSRFISRSLRTPRWFGISEKCRQI